MLDLTHKALLIDLFTSKLRLPNIKRIKIDKVVDQSKDLNNFLDACIPLKLDLLLVNFNPSNNKGIKMSYYLDSLWKAIKGVSKEVYLYCFELIAEELQEVIKSAYNWERLAIGFSSIHCSDALDFNIKSKYNIKFLSFAGCGNSYSEITTDWKYNPSDFESIVKAISESGLKSSLEIVDIYNCSLDKNSVQRMFNKYKMSHVSVIEMGASPISPEDDEDEF